MLNLFSNYGSGSKFSAWTPKAATLTAPLATYSATSGPDSTPGITISATGTSGSVYVQTPSFSVAPEDQLFLSVVLKASSETPTVAPFTVVFEDSLGNSVLTVIPIAAATAASTSAIQYNATVGVPVGAATAVVEMGTLAYSSTGGYTLVLSSPLIGHA
jgi:hypothetical protein